MALNKFFDIQIKYNGTDISQFCNLAANTFSERNLDYTQVYNKFEIQISFQTSVAFIIKETDVFQVTIQGNSHYFKATRIDQTNVYSKVQLTNIFELLKNERFLIENGSGLVPNPSLASFLDSNDDIITATLETLLKMIINLVNPELTIDLSYDFIAKDYDYNTDTETSITNLFSEITINDDFLLWVDNNNVLPSELLELLQQIYNFNVFVNPDNPGEYIVKSLPLMRVTSNYQMPTRKLTDPDFFNVDQINSLINPVEILNKTYYSEKSVLITERKDSYLIKDTSQTYWQYEYRDDLEIQELTVPDNLDLSEVSTPYKIQFDGSLYTLKSGLYHSYCRWFSYLDIIQNSSTLLDYSAIIGYLKTDYIFSNEENEEVFSDFKNARKCIFDTDRFVVILTDNKVLTKNSIRG